LTVSLAADVTTTRNILADQNGPVVLVGHSYGGVFGYLIALDVIMQQPMEVSERPAPH
jgi:pimeloyl-ACP methyl ester carboxylesterase